MLYEVITGVPDRTLILQSTHHAMIDGASGIQLTTVLYDFDAKGANVEPPPSEPWSPAPMPSAGERFAGALRENLTRMSQTDAFAAWRANGHRRELLRRAFSVLGRFVAKPAITAPFT